MIFYSLKIESLPKLEFAVSIETENYKYKKKRNNRKSFIEISVNTTGDYTNHWDEREFYINDAGNQINKFGLSLDLRYLQLYKEGIEMPEDSYHGADIIAHAKAFADIHGDAYVKSTEEDRRKALVEFALPKNIQGLHDDLLKYRIQYNTWFKESSLHAGGETSKVLAHLEQIAQLKN